MPLISVTYSSVRKSPSLKAEIASAVSDLTARILRKDPKVTAIIVKSVDAADWFAGGRSLAEQSLASFWLDVHVSEGTNTKDEKAAYLAALFQRMGELLGPLHEESYAHVDEVKGGDTRERNHGCAPNQLLPRCAPILEREPVPDKTGRNVLHDVAPVGMSRFVIYEHGPHVRHAQMVKFAIPLQGVRVVGPPVLEWKPVRRHRDLLSIPLPLDMWPCSPERKTS
jgi:4-oxalocrotonate tautomerase